MSRSPDPRNHTYRALLARSGNQCAFPGCSHVVVNHKNQFVAEVCHIAAAAPGGERYDLTMTHEERRDYKNLLILCHAHHVETDDVEAFPVAALHRMKREHEASVLALFEVPAGVVNALVVEEEVYWAAVQRANDEHIVPNLRVEIDSTASVDELLEEARRLVGSIGNLGEMMRSSMDRLPEDVRRLVESAGGDAATLEKVPYWENPTVNRDWELVNLGFPTCCTRLQVLLDQIQLVVLGRFVAEHPDELEAAERLNGLRAAFLERAGCVGLID